MARDRSRPRRCLALNAGCVGTSPDDAMELHALVRMGDGKRIGNVHGRTKEPRSVVPPFSVFKV